MPKKPSRTTFHKRLDHMVAQLREDIVSGKLSVGEHLPSEVELGKQYQLSKNSVRKGLDMLVDEHLIEKVPRVGNRVSSPAVQGSVTIKLGYYTSVMEQMDLNRLLSDFHVAYPQIRVQTVALPYENYAQAIEEYMQGGMVDVFTINHTDYQLVVDSGRQEWLEPMNPPAGQYPFLQSAFKHRDRYLALPFAFSPVVLCYNRDHFADKGLEEPDSGWTWDDLTETAQKLADERGRFGFYFYFLSQNRWPVFLLQSGESVRYDAQGRPSFCGTKLLEGLRKCRELVYKEGVFPRFAAENDADAEALFLQEKVSMIMTTYFNLNDIREAGFSFDVAPLPYLNEPRTLLLSVALGMNRHSEQKEAARTLIDYLLGEAAQLTMRQNTFSIPSLKKAAEWRGKGAVKHPSRYPMYREIIPSFRWTTDIHLNARQVDAMHQELKWFWSWMEEEDTICRRLEEALS
ncbi:extracellular solute-binding protein [Paenibacillus tyrfis]|uniref:GntR family transcriptional regulator n=1 Tax=Paenibacillus tyrfis TaxID=1501230 RepID=A0A081P550_9BACL|nr:extracellular solute-binding protein [Paenibacillus tyrfis]KEQ25823.1 GntR family transcriptional regulator [Paenibacillus tyrfis]